MNKHTEDQFSECTPEEERFFQEMDARRVRAQEEQRESNISAMRAVKAIMGVTHPHFKEGKLSLDDLGYIIYQAIRDGKVPGVVLEENHGN